MKILNLPKGLTKALLLIISFFCGFIIITNPEIISQSVIFALNNCFNLVIPSVFPLLIVTFFISELGFPEVIKKCAQKITLPLFGLSGNCTEAIITGLTGGYNCSVKASHRLYEAKSITKEEAKRLALFFTCPGLSFSVNICGMALYSSLRAGVIFFISSVLSCLITSALYNLFRRNADFNSISLYRKRTADAFVDSVANSVSVIITICSWITVFSIISSILKITVSADGVNTFISLFGEVTSAVMYSAENYSLAVTSLCLNFGGICIFLQQLPYIIKTGVSTLSYLLCRIIQGGISFIISSILLRLFPIATDVFSYPVQFKAYSDSFMGSFALILLGAVLLYSVKSTKDRAASTKHKTYMH